MLLCRFGTAKEVLEFYGQQRTVDRKGVTIPSQRRYINYYSSIIRDRLVYSPVKLYLQELVIDPIPAFGMPGTNEFYLQFELRQSGKSDDKPFVSPEYLVRKGDRQVRLEVNPPLLICGDVKIEFSSKIKLLDNLGNFRANWKNFKLGHTNKEFHFWFNTFFVDSPFSSDLSHSVTARSPSCSVEEDDHSADVAGNSSSHEGLIMRESIDSSDGGRLLAAPSNGAATGGVYQNRGLRSYPAPERHASCAGGGAPTTDAGRLEDETAESLTNLLKSTSISHDHLLREKSAPLPQHQDAHLQPTPPQQQQQQQDGHRHQPVRHSQSHHLQHQHSHQGHPMATSTSSSSSSSSSSTANSGAASTTTLPSFTEMRIRHTSMPQTKLLPSTKHSSGVFERTAATLLEPPSFSSSSSSSASSPPFNVPGSPVCLKLDKHQVDKAFKDKQKKVYPANFHVHLFLLRPDDQSDAGKFSSSPVCVNKGSGDVCASSGFRAKQKHPSSHDSSSSSSDEDTTDSEALCGGGGATNVDVNVRQQQQQAFHSEWI